MIRCEFCGSELPVNALYCGNCGRKIEDRYATLTDSSNTLETSILEPQTPPLFSSPVHPDIHDSGIGWEDTASTFQTKWDIEDMEGVNRPFKHRITDENDAVFPDVLLPGMLAMRNQVPSPSQPPMVQGTPQFGGAPSVQGTPAVPGNVPQSMPGPAQGAAPAAPSNAPMEAQNIPIHHQQVYQPAYQPPSHFYNPVHHSQPTPPPHQPIQHPQPTPPHHVNIIIVIKPDHCMNTNYSHPNFNILLLRLQRQVWVLFLNGSS